jgi:hypothetical protein
MSARVGVALIVVAIGLLITAGAGASVVSMDRPINVQVVDDEDANVAVEPAEAEVPDNAGSENATERANESATEAAAPLGERELLTVTNRLDEEITVTELEVPDGIENTLWQDGDSIGSGETATLEGAVDCEEIGAEPEASVELSSSGVTISQTVELEVTCQAE